MLSRSGKSQSGVDPDESPATIPDSLAGEQQSVWSLAERVAFRFFFLLAAIHLILSLLPELLWRLPFTFDLGTFWFDRVVGTVWQPAVRWVTRDLLHIVPGPYLDDAPAPPVSVLVGIVCMIVLASLGTVVWSYVDRRRTHYRAMHEWFRVYLRFSVGTLLIAYGVTKILLNQFGAAPQPSDLMTPVGMLGRFSLLAVFMAAAPLYQVFAGAVELIAGALLIVRRTSRLGAFFAVAVMTNVVVLNWAYHFTVYVLSTAMLVMAVVLTIPDLPRLVRLLVLDRPVPAPVRRQLFASVGAIQLSRAAGLIFLLAVVVNQVQPFVTTGSRSQRTPLYGVYEVESVVRSGSNPQIVPSDSTWRWLAVDPSRNRAVDAIGTVAIQRDKRQFVLHVDTLAKTLTMASRRNPKQAVRWSYAQPDASHLVLTGVDNIQAVTIAQGSAAKSNVIDARAHVVNTIDSTRITLRRIELGTLPLRRPQPWFR